MRNTAPEAARPLIAVAAGCLLNAAGEVLIAQRPAGKIAAGQWEFPGGKIEPGESAAAALARELHEELGIAVQDARPLIRIRHDYVDRSVDLDTWRVTRWQGEPHGRENQACAWVRPERLSDYPLLAADRPIVAALRLPADYVFTRPDAEEGEIRRGLSRLPRGGLLRLRLPALDDAAYARLARRLAVAGVPFGLRLILDRAPDLVTRCGAQGWHASAATLRRLDVLPALGGLALASCHSSDELKRARALGFDAAVLGPVLATASHPGQAGLGWARFGAWVAEANLPVFAIGGVGPALQGEAFARYAQGTAGISAYWSRTSSGGGASVDASSAPMA